MTAPVLTLEEACKLLGTHWRGYLIAVARYNRPQVKS